MKFRNILRIVAVLAGLLLLASLATQPASAEGPEANPTTTPGPGGSDCDQAQPPQYCFKIELDDETQSGDYTAPAAVTKVVLKAGQDYTTVTPEQNPYNGACYSVIFSSSQQGGPLDTINFEKTGGEQCQNLSHVQIWWEVHPTALTLTNFTAEPKSSFNALDWFGILILAIGLAFLQYEWRRRRRRK